MWQMCNVRVFVPPLLSCYTHSFTSRLYCIRNCQFSLIYVSFLSFKMDKIWKLKYKGIKLNNFVSVWVITNLLIYYHINCRRYSDGNNLQNNINLCIVVFSSLFLLLVDVDALYEWDMMLVCVCVCGWVSVNMYVCGCMCMCECVCMCVYLHICSMIMLHLCRVPWGMQCAGKNKPNTSRNTRTTRAPCVK